MTSHSYFSYVDAPAALTWLEKAFGFETVLRWDSPSGVLAHAELRLGEAAIVLFADAIVHKAEWYEEHDVELKLGTTVTKVDVEAKELTLDDDVGDALPDGGDDPGRLVAEQERELVVDPALAVVQVGVAHPARLHLDDGLPRTGVGHVDRLDADGLTLGARDDCLDLVHADPSPANRATTVGSL